MAQIDAWSGKCGDCSGHLELLWLDRKHSQANTFQYVRVTVYMPKHACADKSKCSDVGVLAASAEITQVDSQLPKWFFSELTKQADQVNL